MSVTTPMTLETYTSALRQMFDEAFDEVHGMILDPGDSLFPTLSTVSAEEASRRISSHCAPLAAQVEHVCVYLDMAVKYANGAEDVKVDWAAAWARESVTPEEWDALKDRLRSVYNDLLAAFDNEATWANPDAVSGSMAALAHTFYHLGEIRQGLGVLRG
jgi:hypothetical protein